MQKSLLMKLARSFNNKSKLQSMQPAHKKIDNKKNLKKLCNRTNNAGQKTYSIENE
jgi:hypothetical protein